MSSRTDRNSVNEAEIPGLWENIANDLDMVIDPEYAMGSGELLVEFPTGMRVRQAAKMKIADVRNAPTKIKCPALAASGHQDDLFLLAFINPDVPSMEKPIQRSVTLYEMHVWACLTGLDSQFSLKTV